jgi:hypothetical protein
VDLITYDLYIRCSTHESYFFDIQTYQMPTIDLFNNY